MCLLYPDNEYKPNFAIYVTHIADAARKINEKYHSFLLIKSNYCAKNHWLRTTAPENAGFNFCSTYFWPWTIWLIHAWKNQGWFSTAPCSDRKRIHRCTRITSPLAFPLGPPALITPSPERRGHAWCQPGRIASTLKFFTGPYLFGSAGITSPLTRTAGPWGWHSRLLLISDCFPLVA